MCGTSAALVLRSQLPAAALQPYAITGAQATTIVQPDRMPEARGGKPRGRGRMQAGVEVACLAPSPSAHTWDRRAGLSGMRRSSRARTRPGDTHVPTLSDLQATCTALALSL